MSRVAVPIASVALAACVQFAWAPSALAGAHDALIAKHAAENGVPEPLVRRVIKIESRGRASVVHKGNYGLMQIRLGTARSMGYSGDAEGLLDPDTNLTYAVKYLAGAYRAAGCDADRAVAYYKRGYHGVKRGRCGSPGIEIAQADADSNMAKAVSAKRKHDAASAPAVDVIKPRLVQTELISKSKPEAAPRPQLAKFEPVRISAVSAARIQPVPIPVPKPAALTAKPELAAATAVASLESDIAGTVPLPRVRPEPKPDAQPARRVEHRQPAHRAEHTHRAGNNKAEDASDVPGAVVSFFKKLTTPDKKARKSNNQESAQTSSPSQNF